MAEALQPVLFGVPQTQWVCTTCAAGWQHPGTAPQHCRCGRPAQARGSYRVIDIRRAK